MTAAQRPRKHPAGGPAPHGGYVVENETTFVVPQPATVQSIRSDAPSPSSGWVSVPLDPPVSVQAGETVALSIPRTVFGPARGVRNGDTMEVRGVSREVMDRRTYQDGAFRPVVDGERP